MIWPALTSVLQSRHAHRTHGMPFIGIIQHSGHNPFQSFPTKIPLGHAQVTWFGGLHLVVLAFQRRERRGPRQSP